MKLRVAKFALVFATALLMAGLTLGLRASAQTAAPTISSISPTSGYVGSTVTIKGSGLSAVIDKVSNKSDPNAVKFNGKVAASYSVVDDATINAVVASGTTSGPVSVTTPSGTATSASAFTLGTGSPSFSFQICKLDGTGCVSNGGTLNVDYSPVDNSPPKIKVKWSGSNLSWCWGYRWSTLQKDADGSGWVQPPDLQTAADSTISSSVDLGPLTSNKTFSLDCGQPNNPQPLQTINVSVGAQTVKLTSLSPNYGYYGTNVAIIGQGFGPAASDIKSLKFGTDATCRGGKTVPKAQITFDGTTQLTAVIQKNTPTGKVCLKNGTTTVISAFDYTVPANPPKIVSFTSSSASVAFDGSVTLSWHVTDATWCWGTGWSTVTPGGSGWVEAPGQTSTVPNNFSGTFKIDNLKTRTTFGLRCGTPGGVTPDPIPPDVAANLNPTPLSPVTVDVAAPPAATIDGSLPYIQVNGGDVFAGGWFYTGSVACSSSDPAYNGFNHAGKLNPDPAPPDGSKGALSGGIATWGISDSQGSRTNQSVLATGGIAADNNGSSQTHGLLGFLSPNANGLSFANTGSGIGIGQPYWGGEFEGTSSGTHCIPDYYGTKYDLPKAWPNKLKDLGSGQYLAKGIGENPVFIPASTIDTSQNISLFVEGNAYISGDITYKSENEDIGNIPKLAIIVSGNIYIDPSVGQLDGFYVAQPNYTTLGDDCATNTLKCHGIIFTCHPNSGAGAPDRTFLNKNCHKALTINGAVAAADVEFDRVRGDMTGKNDNITPAETINFTPEMVLGGSFFHGPSSASSNQTKIDSLISLPPIF